MIHTDTRTLSLYDEGVFNYWFDIHSYYSIRFDYFKMDQHRHTEVEFMYALDGDCLLKLNGQEVLRLKEGHYVCLDSMITHELIVEHGSPCHVVNIEASLVAKDQHFNLGQLRESPHFVTLCRTRPTYFICNDSNGMLHSHFKNLLKLLDGHENVLEVNLCMALLIAEAARQFSLTLSQKKEYIPCFIRKALDYIGENYDRDISLNDIAANSNVSRSHLQHSFKSHTGCSVISTINQLRINKAMMLLSQSNLPIVDISMHVGFNSRQHFTDYFRKSTGMSPNAYRKQRGFGICEHNQPFTDVNLEPGSRA